MNQEKYEQMREKLKIDCSQCLGLCCIGLYCMKADGFPADKPAGTACRYLTENCQCKVHNELFERNYKGCENYDCIGSGQRATQICKQSEEWIKREDTTDFVIGVYYKIFDIHQMLWYLLDAYQMADDELKDMIGDMIEQTDALVMQKPEILLELDLCVHRKKVNELLKEACKRMEHRKKSETAYYFAHNFKRADLDDTDFSQALMIGSNLEGCSLRHVNFLGADMRDVNVKNADLSSCYYLTQMQVNSMKGNRKTILPNHFDTPAAWLV